MKYSVQPNGWTNLLKAKFAWNVQSAHPGAGRHGELFGKWGGEVLTLINFKYGDTNELIHLPPSSEQTAPSILADQTTVGVRNINIELENKHLRLQGIMGSNTVGKTLILLPKNF